MVRQKDLNNVYNATDDPTMFIFVDESAKGVNASRRRRGWAPVGGIISYSDKCETWMNKLYCFIAAMDMDGFVFSAGEIVFRSTGADNTNQSTGTVNREWFEDYVE